MSRRAPGLEALDIVCGTLQAKLQTSDLSCGTSPCILLGSRKISPCQFQCKADKAASRNWKATIQYRDKPLSHFLESYVDLSGKRCCCFIIPSDAPLRPSTTVDMDSISQSPVRPQSPTPPTPQESPRPPELFNHSHQDSPKLPEFPPVAKPDFVWGHKDSTHFCRNLDVAYREVVHWQRNVFEVPRCSAGRAFVSELARLFCAVGQGFALESVALKAVFVACSLLLQRTNTRSKPTDDGKF